MKDKPREPFKPNASNNNDKKKCHKCGCVENLANNCLKKANINEILEKEDQNHKEEKSDSEKDTEASETSESDEINIINAKINNIDLIYEVLDVNSNLRQVGTSNTSLKNIQDEVTTPVIITWRWKFKDDIRALNTYTIPDRYPIPRINDTLTQLSQAKFITAMDALKGFHQNFLTENSRRLLRIIVHCGNLAYLRFPFGIKNAPSHYQRMMNTIFPEELLG
ncbi:hypothetical protein O181_011538 [Austropuccinia psidii MF-1]|uniref:Reverse transcriptase domain-containing protein n=1 Tax=Austropuccinia psidii MF-1 TaxID=1389203 RepID=A0A9Q3BVH2_9BASI|nr:hypothetical protein [Austropuccinia psidii MF-1]